MVETIQPPQDLRISSMFQVPDLPPPHYMMQVHPSFCLSEHCLISHSIHNRHFIFPHNQMHNQTQINKKYTENNEIYLAQSHP